MRVATRRLHVGEEVSKLYAGLARATPADRVLAQMLADSPLGLYRMHEESGLAQDSSGNAAHMTTNNIATNKAYRVPGPFAGSYGTFMTGGSNFTRAVLTAAVNNWTLELWFKFVAAGGDDTILVNGTRAGVGYSMDWVAATTKIRGLYGGVAFLSSSAATFGTTAWIHFVMVRDAGTAKYYVNGAVDTANAGTGAPNTPTTKTQIGSDGSIAGIWSHCAVYASALSAARIAAHYTASGL